MMGKQLTAWSVGGAHAVTLNFEDESVLCFDPVIDEDDDLAVQLTGYIEDDEEPSQPETAQERYAQLAQNVENVYTHTVSVDNVSGALVCGVCQRENSELGEEACDD